MDESFISKLLHASEQRVPGFRRIFFPLTITLAIILSIGILSHHYCIERLPPPIEKELQAVFQKQGISALSLLISQKEQALYESAYALPGSNSALTHLSHKLMQHNWESDLAYASFHSVPESLLKVDIQTLDIEYHRQNGEQLAAFTCYNSQNDLRMVIVCQGKNIDPEQIEKEVSKLLKQQFPVLFSKNND